LENISFRRPDAKHLKIEILRYSTFNKRHTRSRHRHQFHSIFLITEGRSYQEIDFKDYVLEANQLIWIPQGAGHWEKRTEHLDGFIIQVTDDFFSPRQQAFIKGFMLHATILGKLIIKLTIQQKREFMLMFELLLQEQTSQEQKNQTFILQNLMLALLNKMEGLVDGPVGHLSFIHQRLIFQQFIMLLETNYREEKSVSFYTDQLQ